MRSSSWTRWFPAAAEGSRWRLIRFDAVDAAGNAVGKAIERTGVAGGPLRFPDEQRAQLAANWLNQEEGR